MTTNQQAQDEEFKMGLARNIMNMYQILAGLSSVQNYMHRPLADLIMITALGAAVDNNFAAAVLIDIENALKECLENIGLPQNAPEVA